MTFLRALCALNRKGGAISKTHRLIKKCPLNDLNEQSAKKGVIHNRSKEKKYYICFILIGIIPLTKNL